VRVCEENRKKKNGKSPETAFPGDLRLCLEIIYFAKIQKNKGKTFPQFFWENGRFRA